MLNYLNLNVLPQIAQLFGIENLTLDPSGSCTLILKNGKHFFIKCDQQARKLYFYAQVLTLSGNKGNAAENMLLKTILAYNLSHTGQDKGILAADIVESAIESNVGSSTGDNTQILYQRYLDEAQCTLESIYATMEETLNQAEEVYLTLNMAEISDYVTIDLPPAPSPLKMGDEHYLKI